MKLSESLKSWMKEQVDKYQKSAFLAGRQATLKSLHASMVMMPDEFFTKDNILMILKDLIEESEDRE